MAMLVLHVESGPDVVVVMKAIHMKCLGSCSGGREFGTRRRIFMLELFRLKKDVSILCLEPI